MMTAILRATAHFVFSLSLLQALLCGLMRQSASTTHGKCLRPVERLPVVSHLDTFGCELTLLDGDTHQALQDPIQEDLWWNTQFHLVVQECFRQYDCKEQLQGEDYEDYPKAVWVPANDTGILEAKAFFSVAGLRRVKVDPGFHTIDRQAWRYCHSLQIVKSPDTVVAIEYAAFQGVIPWSWSKRRDASSWVRLFSECCA